MALGFATLEVFVHEYGINAILALDLLYCTEILAKKALPNFSNSKSLSDSLRVMWACRLITNSWSNCGSESGNAEMPCLLLMHAVAPTLCNRT